MDAVHRAAARILLLDETDRVFLLHHGDPDGRTWWATPGGGLEPGESHEDAARRELREELGLDDVEIGPAIWVCEAEFTYKGERIRARERFSMLRVAADRVRLGPVRSLDTDVIGWRWWALADIEATTATVWPRKLAAFTRALLAEGPPDHPLDVGV